MSSPIHPKDRLHNVPEGRLGEIIATGNDLKNAFRKVAPTLGHGLMEIIANQLEIRYLIVMHGKTTYTLADLANALSNVVGQSSAYMIIDEVVQHLNIEVTR